MNICTTAINFI